MTILIFLSILTISEYNPPAQEEEEINTANSYTYELSLDDDFSLLSWNIGFAAQGKDTDSFLDGGKDVIPSTKEGVMENLKGIEQTILENNPDFIFMQEIDTDSKRSNYIDEFVELTQNLGDYASTFAINYSTLYVPYPLPITYGKVNAGIATFSKYAPTSSTRISLPNIFSWPKSTIYL